jgi:uncharacterized membrane protein
MTLKVEVVALGAVLPVASAPTFLRQENAKNIRTGIAAHTRIGCLLMIELGFVDAKGIS